MTDQGVEVRPRVFMSLQGFCDSQPRGSHLGSTPYGDEEVMAIECGPRVANAIIQRSTTGWDALLDAMFEEDMRRVRRVSDTRTEGEKQQ